MPGRYHLISSHPSFWGMVAEGLPSQDVESLKEDLGLDIDSDEHVVVEKSWLCTPKSRRG
jgi:hypothetical protein